MKRVTIQEIAERCGVSPTVVSAVLNRPEARQRCSKEKSELIRKTAKELCYHPNFLARAMVSQYVPVAALMLNSSCTGRIYRSNYFEEIATNFICAMKELQIEVLISFYRTEEEQIENFESLLNKGLIGGAASNIIPFSYDKVTDVFRKSGLPYIVFGNTGKTVLSVHMDSRYPFAAEYHKRFGTKRAYLLSELEGKQFLYPYEDKPGYNQFSYKPMPASDEITADPENLIIILGGEYYLRSNCRFAHPFIAESINYKYLLPPGVSFALYGMYDGRYERFGAQLLSDWMHGKKTEEKEICLPGSPPVEIFFAEDRTNNIRRKK